VLEYKNYIGTIEADDGAFAGRVVGLRDVVTFEGATFAEVEQTFHDSVDDYLAFCTQRGEAPDRPYSGKIALRVDPEIHRRAAPHPQPLPVSRGGEERRLPLPVKRGGVRGGAAPLYQSISFGPLLKTYDNVDFHMLEEPRWSRSVCS
jgi:predicted HicB family RNase H-like nuclease